MTKKKPELPEVKLISNLNRLFYIFLAFMKSIFMAVTEVAWGISCLFFLSIGTIYLHEKYDVELSSISPIFTKLISLIIDNIIFFVLIFFIIFFIFEYRRLKTLKT